MCVHFIICVFAGQRPGDRLLVVQRWPVRRPSLVQPGQEQPQSAHRRRKQTNFFVFLQYFLNDFRFPKMAKTKFVRFVFSSLRTFLAFFELKKNVCIMNAQCAKREERNYILLFFEKLYFFLQKMIFFPFLYSFFWPHSLCLNSSISGDPVADAGDGAGRLPGRLHLLPAGPAHHRKFKKFLKNVEKKIYLFFDHHSQPPSSYTASPDYVRSLANASYILLASGATDESVFRVCVCVHILFLNGL